MTLTPGAKLGPYEILAPLGAGGMGEVYKAKDARLDRFVAIKVLPEHLAKHPESLARFEREAKAVASLNHPNILAIHDFATHEAMPYVVLELLEGESLRARLAEGPLTPRAAVDLAIQAAHGLSAAHERGVVHRDLKPENLWITREGRLKILDFGLAKQFQNLSSGDVSLQPTEAMSPGHQTEKGMILGTLGYMSPEQVRGEAADARSDLFSFGVVLFEMLTGKRAFARDTASDTMAAILRDDPPDLEGTSRPIPPGLRRVLDHCLEKVPVRRFHDAEDLAFALESALGSASDAGLGLAPPGLPATVRRPWVAALGLVLLGGAAAWFLKPARERTFPTFTQVSFRRGNVLTARFTGDGQSVVYSAAWDGRPAELFLARVDGTGTRPLGYPKAMLQGVNAKGELLLILKPDLWSGTTQGWGTLALGSLEGGTPRELKEQVFSADFAPDGHALAVLYQTPQGTSRVDYPLGTRLLETATLGVGSLHVSPTGAFVAVVLYDQGEATVTILDRNGGRRDLLHTKENLDDTLVWSRDGRRLYASEFALGTLLELDLKGRTRKLHSDASNLILHDQSAQGRFLLEREVNSSLTRLRRDGRDVDLGLGDSTRVADLSRNGEWALLGDDPGRGGNTHTYLRRADGSPPKSLGPGFPQALSPDAKWALIAPLRKTGRLRLVPTGAGVERELSLEGWDLLGGEFSGDGTRVFVAGTHGGGVPEVVEFPLGDAKGRALGVPALNFIAVTPDGKQMLRRDDAGHVVLVNLGDGSARTLAWSLEVEEFKVGWTPEGQLLVAHALDPAHVRVDRVDLATGARTAWQMVTPPDPVGIAGTIQVVASRDGRSVASSFSRVAESNLLIVDGLEAR